MYALSSAAVTYNMARACASGALFHCTCALPPYEMPEGNFKWGGCGDNVRWGSQFTKQFVDSTDKEEKRPMKKIRNAEGKENLDETITDKKILKSKSYISNMNLHNNRVGRRVNVK